MMKLNPITNYCIKICLFLILMICCGCDSISSAQSVENDRAGNDDIADATLDIEIETIVHLICEGDYTEAAKRLNLYRLDATETETASLLNNLYYFDKYLEYWDNKDFINAHVWYEKIQPELLFGDALQKYKDELEPFEREYQTWQDTATAVADNNTDEQSYTEDEFQTIVDSLINDILNEDFEAALIKVRTETNNKRKWDNSLLIQNKLKRCFEAMSSYVMGMCEYYDNDLPFAAIYMESLNKDNLPSEIYDQYIKNSEMIYKELHRSIKDQSDIEQNSSDNSSVENYVGNTKTHTFHYSWCSDVKKIDKENKISFKKVTRKYVTNLGYHACEHCNP